MLPSCTSLPLILMEQLHKFTFIPLGHLMVSVITPSQESRFVPRLQFLFELSEYVHQDIYYLDRYCFIVSCGRVYEYVICRVQECENRFEYFQLLLFYYRLTRLIYIRLFLGGLSFFLQFHLLSLNSSPLVNMPVPYQSIFCPIASRTSSSLHERVHSLMHYLRVSRSLLVVVRPF